MSKKYSVFGALLLAAIVAVFLVAPGVANADRGGIGGRGDGPIIYVTGQDLYYDSIITAMPVPQHGPFQELQMVDGQLQTEFGPGDEGYVGGRWHVAVEDGEDLYFVCPLLGPGRTSP
jgi:hypothetical protein